MKHLAVSWCTEPLERMKGDKEMWSKNCLQVADICVSGGDDCAGGKFVVCFGGGIEKGNFVCEE